MKTTATSIILAAATMFAAMAAAPAAGLSDAEVDNLVRRSYQYVAMYNVNNKFAMNQGDGTPRSPIRR